MQWTNTDPCNYIELKICTIGQLRDVFTEGLRMKAANGVVRTITSKDPWLIMCSVTTKKDWGLILIHAMDRYRSIQLKICANGQLRDVFTEPRGESCSAGGKDHNKHRSMINYVFSDHQWGLETDKDPCNGPILVQIHATRRGDITLCSKRSNHSRKYILAKLYRLSCIKCNMTLWAAQ